MNKRITNITENTISLFIKRDGADKKVDIPAGHTVIADDHETPTLRVFKKRGFVEVEDAQLLESDSFHLLDEEIIETTSNSTVDDTIDSNNDEVMDQFHTTETHEVVIQEPTRLEIVEGEVEKYVEDGYIKGLWTEDDVTFLKKNYPTKGRTFCANSLNRNESSVQKKINSLGLKKKKKKKR